MNWNFFNRRVCLTLGPDWPSACEEFARVGLPDVRRFDALPIDGHRILGPHQSFSGSVRCVLAEFHASGDETLLFLEDDCIFRDLDHLEVTLAQLPINWDILYLGANLVCWNNGEPAPERYSPHLFRVRAAWTTHCVAFNRKVVPFIMAHQPPLNEAMIDSWLSSQLPRLKAYCIAPMVAYQRPRVSAIWGKGTVDDYTDIFLASEERLK